MYVIFKDGFLELGPMKWNKYRFENFIYEEFGIVTTLPLDPVTEKLDLDQSIAIWPMTWADDPEYNKLTQTLSGPYWTFTTSTAIASNQAIDLSVDQIKVRVKDQAALVRYLNENGGVRTEVHGNTSTFYTDRFQRAIYALSAVSMNSTASTYFKMTDGTWELMNRDDMQYVAEAVMTHIQNQFAWEADIVTRVNTASDTSTLISLFGEVMAAMPVNSAPGPIL